MLAIPSTKFEFLGQVETHISILTTNRLNVRFIVCLLANLFFPTWFDLMSSIVDSFALLTRIPEVNR